MCGIAGAFVPGGLGASLRALQIANDLVSYRGPDDAGFLLADPAAGVSSCRAVDSLAGVEPGTSTVGLAHRRLSIIDLSSAGHQPMSAADGAYWIVYNGEIYNYVELRDELVADGVEMRSQSDTEVVLNAYVRWGPECVHRFNGMWAFAILDMRERRLFCSRDRYGIKPFYYFAAERGFAFASEIKQLLQFPFVPRRPDERAVLEFLTEAAVEYCEETFFDGIVKLPQGHSLLFDLERGAAKVVQTYRPEIDLDPGLDRAGAAERLGELLRDSVRLRLRSDVRVGTSLSGGVDSSAVACLIQEQLGGRGDQHTFSCHFDSDEANELTFMEAAIDAVGAVSHFTRPTAKQLTADLDDLVFHQEEPFASTSVFAQWSVCRLAHANGVKVLLDGQGADEQLAGYSLPFEQLARDLASRRRFGSLAREARAAFGVVGAVRRLRRRLLDSARYRLGGGVRHTPPALLRPGSWLARELSDEARYPHACTARPYGERQALKNLSYQLTMVRNLQTLLRYADRSSMAFSVEARLPFLDYRLVEFLFTVPSELLIVDGYSKRILRDAIAGLVPDAITWRRTKLGFATPEQRWLRRELSPLVDEALADEVMKPYVRADAARAGYREYLGGAERSTVPWRWVAVHRWLRSERLWK